MKISGTNCESSGAIRHIKYNVNGSLINLDKLTSEGV